MSGLSRKPGIIGAVTYVREVPIGDIVIPPVMSMLPGFLRTPKDYFDFSPCKVLLTLNRYGRNGLFFRRPLAKHQRTMFGVHAAPAAAPAAAPTGPATAAPNTPPTAAPPMRWSVVVHAVVPIERPARTSVAISVFIPFRPLDMCWSRRSLWNVASEGKSQSFFGFSEKV